MKIYLLGLILAALENTIIFKYLPIDITSILVIIVLIREKFRDGVKFAIFIGLVQSLFSLSVFYLIEKTLLAMITYLFKRYFYGNPFLIKAMVVLAISAFDIFFYQISHLYRYHRLDFDVSYLIFLLFNLIVFSVVYLFDRKLQL